MAARKKGKKADKPAKVRFIALPPGDREKVNFKALSKLSLRSKGWMECSPDWRASFLPAAEGAWAEFPKLSDFFIYNGSGVMPGRTWIIAPDAQSLEDRWDRLVKEKDRKKKEVLFHPHEGGIKYHRSPYVLGFIGTNFELFRSRKIKLTSSSQCVTDFGRWIGNGLFLMDA